MHCLARRPVENPDQLWAILRFKSEGWTRVAICRALRISKATYFRRLAEARRLAAEDTPELEECDD